MPIINQTASISGISSNLDLFVVMMIMGGILIFIVWIFSQMGKN